MSNPPIILVPGFWLGAWAWDEVTELLRNDGFDVTALTLSGLESADADRTGVRLSDQVGDITKAVIAAGRPVVLVVHSGASTPGYWASDRAADHIAHMVYVDTAPPTGAMDPEFADAEKPLPSWEEMAEDPGNSVEGIPQEKLDEFRRRAVPQPGAALREAPILTSKARLEIPSTVIATTFPAEDYRKGAEQGYAWLGGLLEVKSIEYVELPTSHWPMWSKPQELARIVGDIARSHATPD